MCSWSQIPRGTCAGCFCLNGEAVYVYMFVYIYICIRRNVHIYIYIYYIYIYMYTEVSRTSGQSVVWAMEASSLTKDKISIRTHEDPLPSPDSGVGTPGRRAFESLSDPGALARTRARFVTLVCVLGVALRQGQVQMLWQILQERERRAREREKQREGKKDK